ncbi:MAG: thiamine pyrophosphate-binding protein [bacterium]|nr:thiamine pyrophosphate-binding protein [bacterium]
MTAADVPYSGGDLVVDLLAARGIRHVFSVSGGPLNPIYHATRRAPVRIVHTRHEAAAAFMAEGTARVTRSPGVCAVTLGPGVTNTVTPALTAVRAGVPFLILGGQAPVSVLDKESVMSFDPLPVMMPVTKYAARVVDPDRIEEYLDAAWTAMTSGRPGPAFLEIPVDVLAGSAPPPTAKRAKGGRRGPGLVPEQAERLVHLVSGSRRPLLVAGDDVLWSTADDVLADAVDHLRIPFVTLRLGRGLVDEHHPYYAGVGYLGSNPQLRHTIADADLVLVVGHEFEADLGYGGSVADDAVVIQSHPDAAVVGKFLQPDLGLVAGSDIVLGVLANVDPGGLDRAWCRRVAEDWRSWRDRAAVEPQVEGEGIHPARLTALLEQAMPSDTTFVTSHGNIDFWADPVLRVRPPGRYLRAGQSGALGAEIPFGVAAKLASPASTVVVIVGDGGFAFHGFEMETALRYGAPIIVVIYDDEKWGAIALPQQRAYGTEIELDLPRRPWWQVMEAMGGHGEYVDDEADLGHALRRAMESGLPAVVQVKVPSVEAPYVAYHS